MMWSAQTRFSELPAMPCLALSKPSVVRRQLAVAPSGYEKLNNTLHTKAVELEGPVHAEQKPKTLPGRYLDSRDRPHALQ